MRLSLALADAAVLEWAVANGANVSCHWFQPLASNGVRHGQSAMVQNMFVRFDKNGVPHYKFDADDLREGETDGSSYNNGGMRATHTAGGYLKIVRTALALAACLCASDASNAARTGPDLPAAADSRRV